MNKNVIFCFSGTGNCLDIANTIAKSLGDTDIVMMRRRPAVRDVHEAERVGFVFPCYAGGLPGDVEKYVRGLFISAKAYTFGVVSYAGYPGVGLAKLNEIVPLSYHAGISHQSACIWLMPHTLMVPPLTPEKAQKRSEELAAKIAEDVKNGVRSDKAPSAPLFNRLEAAVWPRIAPKKAESFTVSGKCIGCGQCAAICPKGNIRMVGGRPDFGTDCLQCLSCLQFCPRQAIHMGGATEKRERWHNPHVTAAELNEAVIHID